MRLGAETQVTSGRISRGFANAVRRMRDRIENAYVSRKMMSLSSPGAWQSVTNFLGVVSQRFEITGKFLRNFDAQFESADQRCEFSRRWNIVCYGLQILATAIRFCSFILFIVFWIENQNSHLEKTLKVK